MKLCLLSALHGCNILLNFLHVCTSFHRVVKEASIIEIREDRGQEVREVALSKGSGSNFLRRLLLLQQCHSLLLHPALLESGVENTLTIYSKV